MTRAFLALLLLGAACTGGGAVPAPPSPAADTARGIVAEVGSERSAQLVLKQLPGQPYLALTGARTAAMRRTIGADVWVSGTRTGNAIDVAEFQVRAVDGRPALDGRLAMRGGQLVLVTADGAAHLIVHPPPALRDRVGARVWIVGPPDRTPASYGIIEEPPGPAPPPAPAPDGSGGARWPVMRPKA